MERLTNEKKSGINGNALRTWALLFAAAGVIGRGTIQTYMLGMAGMNTQQMLEVMGSSESAMTLTTCAVVLQALETCAVPIFALMLVQGAEHTADFKAYFLRVLGAALITEIPYNLAMGGKLLDLGSRNPVFSLVVCLILIYLAKFYPEKNFKHRLTRIVLTVAGILWCEMLKIDFGMPTVLIAMVLWAFRSNSLYRNFAGAAAAMVCTVYSPFFLASPMGFMPIHFHNGEESTASRRVNYLAYPVILLLAVAAGITL